jgi:hypothetical protein
MDPIDNIPSAPVASPSEDLQTQVDKLRQLVQTILVLAMVVSGTFTIYLTRQVKYSREDLQAIRPQATNMIGLYEKNVGPATDEFIKKLAVYGGKHPDFAPIMTKYNLQSALTNAPAKAAPAPAKPVPQPGPAPQPAKK